MSLMRETTTLTIQRSEALLMFELLTQSEGESCIPLRTAAERLAVSRLLGALEGVLVEPFSPDYAACLAEAQSALQSEAGEVSTAVAA